MCRETKSPYEKKKGKNMGPPSTFTECKKVEGDKRAATVTGKQGIIKCRRGLEGEITGHRKRKAPQNGKGRKKLDGLSAPPKGKG